MRLVVSFDTEDFTDPATNDVLLRICQTLTARGVRASFGLVGEKARYLRDLGRQDVLEALAQHIICYHTDNHFLFPDEAHSPRFASEIVEERPWREAVEWLIATESRGLADIEHLFGRRPTTYLRTCGDSAPQILAAFHRLGLKTFAYGLSLNERTRHLASYANQHCISLPLLSEELTYAGKGPAELDRLAQTGADLINVRFHPCRFLSDEWWSIISFLDTRTPAVGGPYRPAPHVPAEETEQRLTRLGELVDYARERYGATFTSYDELTAQASRPPTFLSRAQVEQVARAVRTRLSFVELDGFALSLAEAFGVLVWAALHPEAAQVPVRPLLGPVELPPSEHVDRLPTIPAEQILHAARVAEAEMARTGHVPHNTPLLGQACPPSALLQAAAAELLGKEFVGLERAPVFPDGFDDLLRRWDEANYDLLAFFPHRGRPVPNTKLAIKLQYWSYRPAEVR